MNKNESKLKKTLEYVSNNSPYYFKSKKTILDGFPLMDKELYKDIQQEILNPKVEISSFSEEFTSGSTGKPFICYKSSKDKLFINRSLVKERKKYFDQFSVNLKSLRFYGSWTPISKDKNTLLLSVFFLNNSIFQEYVEEIISWQPTWIFGTPSSIYEFIKALEKNKLENYFLKNVNIKYIETTGEFLSQEIRQKIDLFFGVITRNHYGCREIWHIALGCSSDNLHICTDNAFVEILNSNLANVNKDEYGEIYITGLNNRDAPFIRYKLGDLGAISSKKCECGNESPILLITGARVTEKILLKDNLTISSVFIHHLFRKVNYDIEIIKVLKYKVIQNEINKLLFYIEPSNFENTHLIEIKVRNYAQLILNIDMEFEFIFTSDIKISNNGKYKTFENLLI